MSTSRVMSWRLSGKSAAFFVFALPPGFVGVERGGGSVGRLRGAESAAAFDCVSCLSEQERLLGLALHYRLIGGLAAEAVRAGPVCRAGDGREV